MQTSGIEYTISPPKRYASVNWKELWRYKDLFVALASRDISVRYKQTILGASWAIFQPFVTMVVFTFVFHGMAKFGSGDGTPYPIFLYVGLLLWQYFANTLVNASNSVINNTGLIQKVYFPRLIVPATAATTGLVDLAIASLILIGLMIYYGFCPKLVGLLAMPVLIASTALFTVGMGLFFAAINVKHRDVRYVVPFLVQIMMYVTPVIYPVKMLDSHPTAKCSMLWCNPMSGIIANARAGMLGKSPIDWQVMGISLFVSACCFIFGIYYFRYSERCFADIV